MEVMDDHEGNPGLHAKLAQELSRRSEPTCRSPQLRSGTKRAPDPHARPRPPSHPNTIAEDFLGAAEISDLWFIQSIGRHAVAVEMYLPPNPSDHKNAPGMKCSVCGNRYVKSVTTPGNSGAVQQFEPHLCPEHQDEECAGKHAPCPKCRPKEEEDP
jgi:hypothetical protein